MILLEFCAVMCVILLFGILNRLVQISRRLNRMARSLDGGK